MEAHACADATVPRHPMDLADAALIAAAEQLDLLRIFTLDSHFRAYRVNGKQPFDIVP